MFLVLDCLLKVHYTMQQMVVSDSWHGLEKCGRQEAIQLNNIVLDS